MKDIEIITLVLGEIRTNTYIAYHKTTKECFIVDPADTPERIIDTISKNGLTATAIVLTHGHCDHIMASLELKEHYGVKIYAGKEEAWMLLDDKVSHTAEMNRAGYVVHQDVFVEDGETLDLIGKKWKAIHTPGHTPGGTCYYCEDEEVMFSGDTLFRGTYGRCDLIGGDHDTMLRSLFDKLFVLPDDIVVYPGHEMTTTIGYEKQHNEALYYRR
jgi:hydroxyacylglutathione hydrolase